MLEGVVKRRQARKTCQFADVLTSENTYRLMFKNIIKLNRTYISLTNETCVNF